MPNRQVPAALVAILTMTLVQTSAAAETEANAELEAGTEVAAAPAEASNATPAIEKLHEGLLSVMMASDEIGYSGRFERLHTIVTDSFDLGFMAEKSVGRHWKKLTADEQKVWLDSFHEMTAATYAGRFEGFSGQSFEILGEEPASHETVVVRAMVRNPDGEDVQLNYRLHTVEGAWKVIDVYLNGTVSELALRRSEYGSVLKRDGFEKLIQTIDSKTQELAASGVN